MILAAGVGQRMRPLTDTTPKPLIEVGGKALLAWHLERLAAAGFTDIVVNAAWLAEQVVAFCGDGSAWGVNLSLSVEPEPLETAGGVINALPLLGDSPFLLVNGDVYTEFPFANLAGVRPALAGAELVLVANPPQHPEGDFTLACAADASPETPERPTASEPDALLGPTGAVMPKTAGPTLTYSGIGVYHPGFFAGLAPGKRRMLPLFERAMAAGVLEGAHFRGVWEDVGTPERLAGLDARLRGEVGSLAMPPAPE